MSNPFPNARRYYLLSRLTAHRLGDLGLASLWRHKQEAEAGALLASDFPSRAALVAAGYATAEDLDGATEDELITNVPTLSRREIAAVLAAL